jgi:D-Tyr-tRNAtyr deacylase
MNKITKGVRLYAQGKFANVEHGAFAAEMNAELVNEGPFTVILENF